MAKNINRLAKAFGAEIVGKFRNIQAAHLVRRSWRGWLYIRDAFPDNKVLIFGPGMRVEVVRP